MSRIPCKSSLLNSIALTMLFAGLTAAQALPTAGAKRPAGVPENYVITPYGYFHPRLRSAIGRRRCCAEG